MLTVGATANQNGTALYEGVTVLFLAQLAGVDLTLGQHRIEDTTAVIYRDVAPKGHAAGLPVDLHDGDVTAKWKDEARWLEIPSRLQPRLDARVQRIGEISSRSHLSKGDGFLRYPSYREFSILQSDIRNIGFQYMSSDLLHLLSEFLDGVKDGHTADCCGAATIRAASFGCGVGVAM